jgi:hypothetical protein
VESVSAAQKWGPRIFVMVAGAAVMLHAGIRACRQARKPVPWLRAVTFIALVESLLVTGYLWFDMATGQ